jgi:hypothetical protein
MNHDPSILAILLDDGDFFNGDDIGGFLGT